MREKRGLKMSQPTKIDRIDEARQSQGPAEAKRPYIRPVLLAHGSLREITLGTGTSGAFDTGCSPSGCHNRTA
jgi:hypothetical protein